MPPKTGEGTKRYCYTTPYTTTLCQCSLLYGLCESECLFLLPSSSGRLSPSLCVAAALSLVPRRLCDAGIIGTL
jgi:hypothetical protein